MSLSEKVRLAFQEKFGADPTWISRSPGRVNIIGEHTDYNNGFVLPLAISYDTRTAVRSREDSRVLVAALDKGEELEFDIRAIPKGLGGWQEYVTGVAWTLEKEGWELAGWEGVFSGDVPIGAGLSSSAALELSLARAFALAAGQPWDPKQAALACQRAENDWVGINSGIMDQLVSACGKRDSALLIDCRSLETRQVPLPAGIKFVILDTSTRRSLVDSAYNERRSQCDAAARELGAASLRDVTPGQLIERVSVLDPILYQRARHVLRENQRVLEAVQALEDQDLERVGELMNASHASLRDDFEVSREEIDCIVAIAQAQPGCYGARLTGAGFGGCAVALVEESQVADFQEEVIRDYRQGTGLEAQVYLSTASEGTGYEEYLRGR